MTEISKSIYIAGKMSGEPDHNYPAFIEAEKAWDAQGWKVYNPVRHSDGVGTNLPYSYYIRASVKDMLLVDAIALLPKWEQSRGAKLELHLALLFDLPIYDALTFERLENIDLIVESPDYFLGEFFGEDNQGI